MSKFLLDANLSPLTAGYLVQVHGIDAVHVRDLRPATISDEEIVALAKAEGRVILTFDTDFGEIYHFRERGTIGVVVLQLRDQTVESVNRILDRFFRENAGTIDLESSLVVVERDKLRIVGG